MSEPGETEWDSLLHNIKYGTHLCLFYTGKADLLSILLSYFKDGLEHNDACVCITSRDYGVTEVTDYLRQGIPDIDERIRKHQIEILPIGDSHDLIRLYNPKTVMEDWISMHNKAVSRGYSGLRILTNPSWLVENIRHDMIHCEHYINTQIAGYSLIIMCPYQVDRIGATDIPYVLSNHQISLFRSEGNWKFFESLELKNLREALQESEQKFTTLTESSQAGILVIQGGKIIYANPAARVFTEYAGDELQRLKFRDLFIKYPGEAAREAGTGKPHGRTTRSETLIRSRTAKERWVDCSSTSIFFGGKPATLVTMLDISERKQAATQLAEAKAHAELLVDLMGHDITNLNQIAIGFLELGLDVLDTEGKLERTERDYLEKPVETIRRSSRLIQNIKKLQDERAGIHKQSVVDIRTVLKDVSAQYSHVPDRDMAIRYTETARCQVRANELLPDVFANLIDNAIKHTTGPLLIDLVQSKVTLGGKDYCQVAVEDNGQGIPDEEKQKLFVRICHLKAEEARKGIGLCLVKTLVEDFHGRFWVEDRVPGDHTQGARFVVVLPAIAAESGTPAQQAQT